MRPSPGGGVMGHVGEPCGNSLARRTYRDGHRRITWRRLEEACNGLPYRYATRGIGRRRRDARCLYGFIIGTTRTSSTFPHAPRLLTTDDPTTSVLISNRLPRSFLPSCSVQVGAVVWYIARCPRARGRQIRSRASQYCSLCPRKTKT